MDRKCFSVLFLISSLIQKINKYFNIVYVQSPTAVFFFYATCLHVNNVEVDSGPRLSEPLCVTQQLSASLHL